MRKEIYAKVCAALASIEGRSGERVVKHINLWNRNVEFIEQESGWERPAVFIEFGTITWRAVKDGAYVGRGQLRLHVVTDWLGSLPAMPELDSGTSGCDDEKDAAADVWELCVRIESVLRGLRGETFHELRLMESLTNHNHEELVETVEVYEVSGVRDMAVATDKEVVGEDDI